MDKAALINKLRRSGLSDSIVNAFSKVKRENFVPEKFASYTYEDVALPTAEGSSISQPSTVAFMLNLLEPKQGQKILEIGSGTGYVLALMSEIVKDGKIYGVEIIKDLAISSKKLLANDSNVQVVHKSGFGGLPEYAPYDRILVSASSSDIEIVRKFLPQLKDPGILVAPVKNSIFQIRKENGKITEKEFQGFAFVPLVKGDDDEKAD